MDHTKKPTYLFSIDALRVIAILAVIVIHISTKTLATLHLDITRAPFSFFLNQEARFAVPLFFLISGFVLELNNKTGLSYTDFFKKRASRIIIPFTFWSTIYFLLAPEYGISKLLSFYFLETLVQGMAAYHLYFIPTLILFYLAFPLLHKSMCFLKNPIALVLITLVQGFILYQDYYIQKIDLQADLRVALLSFSMFIFGMVASHYKDSILVFVTKYKLVFLALLIALMYTIFTHVYRLTTKLHSSSFIYNQYNPLNYIYTLFLSAFLFYVLEKTQFLSSKFIALSKLSFFVFFIHVLIQYILWDNVIQRLIDKNGLLFLTNAWFDPLMAVVIASISFGIAYLVHKISWAPKITG